MVKSNLITLGALAAFAQLVASQQAGTLQTETHPPLTVSTCTSSGCTSVSASVVLDSNWRWTHITTGSTNCYTGNLWNTTICPDPVTCATNCAIDGADYTGTYGITTSGNALNLAFVTHGPYSTNIGSRVYLMNSETTYQILKLKNQEFTFDVDVSNLPCGLNGALYLVDMDADGGMARFSGNKAGAKFGTGYCDTQCPHDIKFIDGEANTINWTPSTNDPNAGTGFYGTCCVEMDIWEANSVSSAYTPHTCQSSITSQTRCSGIQCGDIATGNRYNGVCDKDGCDFNSYRMGDLTFYGPGETVDTTKPFTVVTQFITTDGTSSGTLNQIKRFYVQNGVVIPNSNSNFANFGPYNSITDAFCNAQKTLFGDNNNFEVFGGLSTMSAALDRGMVLVMSLWDDHEADMLWLDSDYPLNKTATTPGVARGTCATTSGVPATVESTVPNSSVKFSNIRWGSIGSTFSGSTSSTSSTSTTSHSTTTTTTTTTTGTSSGTCSAHYGQCGGIGWTGPTCCVSPYTCIPQTGNPYYSQCL